MIGIGISTSAQQTIILDNQSTSVTINKQIQILEEHNSQFSFEDIVSGKFDSLFGENLYETKSLNRNKRTFWAKATVQSNLNENSEWYIQLWNYYSNVECFIIQNGTVLKQKSGWELQLKDRSVNKSELLLSLSISGGKPVTIYMHIETDPMWNNPPELRAEIISIYEWNKYERNHWLVIGLFAGLLILTTLFWIANYFVGRSLLFYLALIISNLFILFYFLDKNNFLSTFIFSNNPWYTISRFGFLYLWYPFLILSIGSLFVTFGVLIKNVPRITKCYIVITCFTFLWLIIIPALSLNEYLNVVTNFIMICWLLFPLISWAFIWIKMKNQIGKIGLIDYSAIGIGWIVECLRNAFLLPDTFICRNLFPIGAALTVTISFFTFLSFVRTLRKKKNKAQIEKEEFISQQNIILEQKIEERTRELNNAYAELSRQEKLAALGTLTSNIAHEIQNPLNFINNFSEIIKEIYVEINIAKTEEEKSILISQLHENISKINEHGKRADGIIKKMFKYLREGKGHELFDDFGRN